MNKMTINITRQDIQDYLNAIAEEDNEFDAWGVAYYGNDEKAVDYNMYIDHSTEEIEYGSAFYPCYTDRGGYWEDDTDKFVPYEIDFNDPEWKQKLENAAREAYIKLWEE